MLIPQIVERRRKVHVATAASSAIMAKPAGPVGVATNGTAANVGVAVGERLVIGVRVAVVVGLTVAVGLGVWVAGAALAVAVAAACVGVVVAD